MYRRLLPVLSLLLFLNGCTTDKDEFKALPPPASTATTTAPASGAPGQPEDPDAWPRSIKKDATTYTVYQPQLDTWDGVSLEARAAVAVQPDGAKETTYGVINLQAKTTVDREERLVQFEDIRVTKVQFPSLPDASGYLDRFQSFVTKDIKDIDLDRLEASLAIVQAQGKPIELKNVPPEVVFATVPTMLVPVDGVPHWTPVGSTGLDRIVNTRTLILRDKIGLIYLRIYDGYVTAPDLTGPWTIAQSVPAAVDDAKTLLVAEKQVDLLAGQPDPETQKAPTIATNGAPVIRVTTKPTELIVTEGEP